MFNSIKQKLGLDPIKNTLDDYIKIVPSINSLEEKFEAYSNEQLAQMTETFKARLQNGETLDDLMAEAFAVVREVSKRVLGMRHYDVQMIGGQALHAGNIAEMRTGEGKTLVATLPVYLNALTGKGVHLITVNDYLARRDARWMAPVYQFLGLSIGVLQMAARTDNGGKAFLVDTTVTSPREDQNHLRMVPRKEAYDADITYGTNSEFGFDYLRDNMTMRLEDRVQRGHTYAIIDEVDNVLIDEARTPLIISGPASDNVEEYYRMARVVKQLLPEEYEASEKDRNVSLTDAGLDHVEELLGMVLRDPSRPEEFTLEQERMMGYLDQALKAEFIFKRNKDYLVQSNKVVIVDSNTGRLMPGRRWSNGLHQAIEAKEGVKVEPENVTYATITLQNYFRMYKKICGMTGTAFTEKEEFFKIYHLDVIPIPTNLEYTARQKGSDLIEKTAKDEEGYKYTYYAEPKNPDVPVYFKRKDYPDVIYQSEEAKFRAITVEILKKYIKGQPMLIGTASVEHSDFLASRLKAEPLRRLVQILMMRRAYMNQNGIEELESPIKEFIPFNKPVQTINAGDLRPFAKTLGIQLSTDDPANKPLLIQEFNLDESDFDFFLKTMESGITPQVLNARKHDEEGMIIANAGAFRSVTIATNMAGRGVDIKLGGEMNEDVLRDTNRVLSRANIDPYNMTVEERYYAVKKVSPDEYGLYEESVQSYIQYYENMLKVRALGGLHVIGSERHESRRIDNQLRGRAARQGDPGSSRFFLSLQDEIVRLFGGQRLESVLNRVNLIDESLALENGMFSKMIEQAQERVEGVNFDMRKHTLEYDDVLNTQRNRIYGQRDKAFTKEDLQDDISDMLKTDLDNHLKEMESEEKWKLAAYFDSVQPAMELDDMFLPSFSQKILIGQLRERIGDAPEKRSLIEGLLTFGRDAYEVENRIGLELMESLIKNTRTSYDTQLQERQANFDLFADSLDDRNKTKAEAVENGQVVESQRPQDVLAEASSFAKVMFKLSTEKQRMLTEADPDVLAELRNQIETTLFAVMTQRLNALIYNRMSGDYEPSKEPLETGDWEAFTDQALDAVQKGYSDRADRLFGTQAQLRTDIENSLSNYKQNPVTDKQWAQLLRTMSEEQTIAFDAKTHKKISKKSIRSNFLFYCGEYLDKLEAEDIRQLTLNHYVESREGLRNIFGTIFLKRLRSDNVVLSQLQEKQQSRVIAALGEETFESIRDQNLMNISEDAAVKIEPALGAYLQNEIDRQVFLRSITSRWVDYLTQIEALRVSISMEGYAQRNPLIVYKTKAAESFTQLLNDIRQAVVERMFVSLPTVAMMNTNAIVKDAEEEAKGNESDSNSENSNSGQSAVPASNVGKKKKKKK